MYYVPRTESLYVSCVVPLMRMCVYDATSFCVIDEDSIFQKKKNLPPKPGIFCVYRVHAFCF